MKMVEVTHLTYVCVVLYADKVGGDYFVDWLVGWFVG